MRHKSGKWYADWRDEHGTRHMKAFSTAAAAKLFTARMRKKIAAKKHRARRTLRKSSAPSRKPTRRAIRAAKPATGSSPRSATSSRARSRP